MGSINDTPLALDFRSDTVTQPPEGMWEMMRAAELGDDGLDGDQTARRLEEETANLLGKDAAIYLPTATMANLLTVLATAPRGAQVITQINSHLYSAERAGSTLAGVLYTAIGGRQGELCLDSLADILLSVSGPSIALVCTENTHNDSGGIVLSLDYSRRLYELCAARGVPVHLDGARIFNASVALGCSAARIAQYADSVTVCLSKGLSAPGGALLVGSSPLVRQARLLRKTVGGTQRQTGILAAAGLYAIRHMSARLAEDHRRACMLAQGLRGLFPSAQCDLPDSNIVLLDLAGSKLASRNVVDALAQVGIQARARRESRTRFVTHRHITDASVAAVLARCIDWAREF
ncbi:threonine aldolase [Advenella kashmirensis W13003]|uniref:Threonine aldolase n=1 Tax=Advenella kashmirensis W13003 TaxID=1424334 RepID=V8QTS5_9BURK|nr:GntG family PLP-dependent aldolase [Advenella kashmirensis]ETF03012.1 threonine aldolase [Advenella kashmirensis W13003]